MVALTAFPLCCGADILNAFGTGGATVDPNGNAGFKVDASGMNYLRDSDGKHIPLTFADKFAADLAKRRKVYPNRMYCCILNQQQYDAHNNGWPKLLKETGFEFVRRWSNSNHDGSYGGNSEAGRVHANYLFVLCTDDKGKCKDFSEPPKGWETLPVRAVETKAAA